MFFISRRREKDHQKLREAVISDEVWKYFSSSQISTSQPSCFMTGFIFEKSDILKTRQSIFGKIQMNDSRSALEVLSKEKETEAYQALRVSM